MRVEIPECQRCCCCLPLRRGVLVFGYLNLAFTIFVITIEAWVSMGEYAPYSMTMIRGVQFHSHLWLSMSLQAAEILFNIVLLVGAHMKKPQLMRAYYYYGITTTVASIVTFMVLWVKIDCRRCSGIDYLMEAAFLVCGIGIQVYLLLLIRSELRKIKQNSQNICYVNHASELMVEAPLHIGNNPF
ncbi:uncharacterized protein LOC120631481 [Pararge aegeria]|uniref:Jg15336 protein n=1 Tax=Pararge aegeria aegeria TaxID=348720 RepID=A0A8S4RHH4_9NEOP|nr:uncharacterized protein LOC120631481 [Pararge aegeria]CAH2236577.1 jg15336 [Pararge aegeria aegeria]